MFVALRTYICEKKVFIDAEKAEGVTTCSGVRSAEEILANVAEKIGGGEMKFCFVVLA